MHSNNGSELTNYNDKRITKIGQLLRKYKLDELPQLMNILKGDMKFIGPRPEIVRIVKNNPKDFSYLKFIKPGMSDINSIIFRDESKLFKKIDVNKYENEILPLKNHLTLITNQKKRMIQIFKLIILLSLFSCGIREAENPFENNFDGTWNLTQLDCYSGEPDDSADEED